MSYVRHEFDTLQTTLIRVHAQLDSYFFAPDKLFILIRSANKF